MFGVGDGVADDAFEEGLQHAAGFFVDHWCRALASRQPQRGAEEGEGRGRRHTGTDTLDTTTTSETTDGRLGYALDVVAEDFAVTLGAAFAEAFAAFTACDGMLVCGIWIMDTRVVLVKWMWWQR